jgi:hypothetical protein
VLPIADVLLPRVFKRTSSTHTEVLGRTERVALGEELNVQAQPHASKMTPGVGIR